MRRSIVYSHQLPVPPPTCWRALFPTWNILFTPTASVLISLAALTSWRPGFSRAIYLHLYPLSALMLGRGDFRRLCCLLPSARFPFLSGSQDICPPAMRYSGAFSTNAVQVSVLLERRNSGVPARRPSFSLFNAL